MERLEKAILNNEDLRTNETLEKHADWVEQWITKYDVITKETISKIIQEEIGIVFAKVLEHAGVYKRDEKGKQAFIRFIEQL